MGHRNDRGHTSSSSSRRHKHSGKADKRSQQDPSDAVRFLKYASLGKSRKLRKLADRQDTASLNTITDSRGATALHQAARHGHLEVVQLLLRRAADPSVCDAAGNTPGHLAAMHGHLLVLTELVKEAGINLDQPNTAGFTVRQIVQQKRQQADPNADPSAGRSQSSGSSPSRSRDDRDTPAAAAAAGMHSWSAAAAAAAGSGMGRADEDDWMHKLAYEMSYDDGGGWQGAWGGAMAAAAAAAAAGEGPWNGNAGSPAHHSSRHSSRPRSTSAAAASAFADGEDDADDAWADRLWRDMQDHRRQAAAAAKAAAYSSRSGSSRGVFGAGPSRDEAAQERERRAAAAAAESARILQEEQAKDADWRAAMKRQIEEAALPLRRSTYEERWQALESWPTGKPITYQDVPWPCPVPGSQAAARKQQQQQQHALVLDPKQLQTLVLAGAKSPADIKLAFRRELMRWHPDKFTARFGPRLAPADKEAIDAGVHAVAQQLTALKQQ